MIETKWMRQIQKKEIICKINLFFAGIYHINVHTPKANVYQYFFLLLFAVFVFYSFSFLLFKSISR